ncbi:hypothetical protein [Arthrobacter livingstonensis]|uniref:hypothetical protein n=1 Tax=Arthrobacter livingstonensis TaxID=670078 RepID=UPI001FEBA080|nr:hypothetical protein [Arthrobacter livingstonensis]
MGFRDPDVHVAMDDEQRHVNGQLADRGRPDVCRVAVQPPPFPTRRYSMFATAQPRATRSPARGCMIVASCTARQ